MPLALTALSAGALREELARSEVRVRSESYPLVAGRTVAEIALVERLGYERVSERPQTPGRFFYGHEVFWIYRRTQRAGGKQRDAVLIGLRLRAGDGRILGGDRAVRIPFDIDAAPNHVWQAVLAAEDARFFRTRAWTVVSSRAPPSRTCVRERCSRAAARSRNS